MSNANTESRAQYVSVGCKLPNGIHLDLKRGDEVIRHTLKGANASRIVGGHGITDGIPQEFMHAWLKKNSKHPCVVNGSIFIHEDAKSIEAIARERSGEITGLEGIDPVKTGMLKNAEGQTDQAALKAYNELKAKNPERNRQQVE